MRRNRDAKDRRDRESGGGDRRAVRRAYRHRRGPRRARAGACSGRSPRPTSRTRCRPNSGSRSTAAGSRSTSRSRSSARLELAVRLHPDVTAMVTVEVTPVRRRRGTFVPRFVHMLRPQPVGGPRARVPIHVCWRTRPATIPMAVDTRPRCPQERHRVVPLPTHRVEVRACGRSQGRGSCRGPIARQREGSGPGSRSRRRRHARRPPGAAAIPPHNLEAEESLLGAMMLGREAITAAVEAHIEAGDFYKPAHGVIFDAALTLHSRGEPVDPVTVAEELRRRRAARRARRARRRCCASRPRRRRRRTPRTTPRSSSELAMLRRLIETAGDIQEMAYDGDDDVDETLDRAESLIFEVAEKRVADTLVPLLPGARADDGSARARSTTATASIVGVPTGYHDLDELLLGLQPSTLTIVAARPGQGKTSLALGAALHCRARRPQAGAVLLDGDGPPRAHEAPARGRSADRRRASCRPASSREHEWPKLNQAVGRLAEAPFFIDDNPHCTVMEMRAKARRIEGALRRPRPDRRRLPAAHVVARKRVESRQVEVSELSRGLKILARELDTPVLCLSQLNRQLEYRQDKRPMLADLRESGCLTADTEHHARRRHDRDDGRAVRVRRARRRRAHARRAPAARAGRHDARVRERRRSRCSSCGSRPGRSVTASANHPFLTLDGWVQVADARAGCAHRRRRGSTARRSTRAATRSRRAVWDYIERKGLLVNGHARPRPRRAARRRRGAATACTSRACRAR